MHHVSAGIYRRMTLNRKIEVCLTPELLHLFQVENKVVVIVDILRATSSMVVGLANGVTSIVPVATTDECLSLRSKGYVVAAERNGSMVEGFDIGNSPFSFMENAVKGRTIAMTTTNGTLALSKSKAAIEIIIGSFLNISSVITFLRNQPNDVLIVCAGWKGHANLEDTLFAGAVVEGLKNEFENGQDSALIAQTIYNVAKNDMFAYLSASSHFKRLERLGVVKDIKYCLTPDMFQIVPILRGVELVVAENDHVVVAAQVEK